MSWSDFYLFCFLLGFSLSVVSFLAGAVHLHLPFKWHFPVHGGHHAASAGAKAGGHISWFNASSVLAFLAWFGGTGYLMTKYSSAVTILILGSSAFAGLAAGWLVLKFLLKLMGPQDEPLRQEDRRVEGALAVVSMPIRENGTGEIIFPVGGVRRCSGARTEDGNPIEKGAEVVIERYEKGIAYVKRWDEFVAS
jgi:membrane protein implicated in regulation of membrane protease activity